MHVTVVADGQTSEFTLNFPAGLPVSVYSNNFESGFAGWTTTGTWALVTTSSHTATHSLHDSPAGNYVNSSATYASLNTPIAMPAGAKLAFWHKYTLESGYDYAYVQVSTNNSTWTTVATYNGTLAAWTQAEVDLGAYAGQSVYLRFRLETDSSVVYDGWYIDDLVVTGLGSQNQTPPPPALVSPYDGGDFGPTAELTAAAAVDPDSSDEVAYGFRVYRDALGTDLAARADDLTSPAFNPELTVDGTYWWRAYAADSEARGDLGETWSFLYTSYAVGAGDALRSLGLAVLGGVTGDRAGIRLDLPRAGALSVDVYNARGQVVRRLHAGDSAAGTVLLTWDGRDEGGRTAPSGVYFVRARAAGESKVGRILMVR
ncbi:MAG: immune inhibitor A [bacterium]|nr:immune inhibitor A [bacterium]